MQPSDSHEPQNVWIDQNEGQQIMQVNIKPEELAALARSRENLNKFAHWAAVIVMSSLALDCLYNVWSGGQALDSVRTGLGIRFIGLRFGN